MSRYALIIFILAALLPAHAHAAGLTVNGVASATSINGVTAGKVDDITVTASGGGGGSSISDDFSADTSGNYHGIYGDGSRGAAISGGVAVCNCSAYQKTWFYHATDLGSANHHAQATVGLWPDGSYSGLVVRCNGDTINSTGYYVVWAGGDNNVYLVPFSGSTTGTPVSWNNAASGLTTGTPFTMRVDVSGSNFTLTINGTSMGTISDSTYSTGSHAGLMYYNNGTMATADNFSAAQ